MGQTWFTAELTGGPILILAAAAPLTQVQGITEPTAKDITTLQDAVSDNDEPALGTAATHTMG